MSNIQINSVQMPKVREMSNVKDTKLDTNFKFTLLGKIEEEQLQDKLTQMVEKISEQGNKIATHMDIRDIKVYRELISEFINEITVNSHKFSRENVLDKKGRHRVFGIIRNISNNLNDITMELMKSEKDNIKVLSKIGEINGLVLDITT